MKSLFFAISIFVITDSSLASGPAIDCNFPYKTSHNPISVTVLDVDSPVVAILDGGSFGSPTKYSFKNPKWTFSKSYAFGCVLSLTEETKSLNFNIKGPMASKKTTGSVSWTDKGEEYGIKLLTCTLSEAVNKRLRDCK